MAKVVRDKPIKAHSPLSINVAAQRSFFSGRRHARGPHLKKMFAGFTILLLAIGLLSVPSPASAANPATVDLGSAATYSVLATVVQNSVDDVDNTGETRLSGDLGLKSSGTIKGFPPGIVDGATHSGDSDADGAFTALEAAYDNAAGRTADSTFSGDNKGRTYVAGVYGLSTFALTGTMYLDGENNPNAVFIFKVDGALTTAADSNVRLINGAKPGNVFWQAGAAVTLGASANFSGTILANGAVTLEQGVSLNGRALSKARVKMNTNTISWSTAPGAPTSVNASAGNTQATVSWTAPSSTGGSAITGYTVTSSGGQTATTTGATTATVTGLTNGTAYTFTVTAANAIGTSAASSASSAVTPTSAATAPGAPTGASATAGDTQATVSWTAPSSNGGSAITGYTVTSSPGSLTATTAGTSATVTGLTNGTAYTFTVTATNAIGTSLASSASGAVTPTSAATVPGSPTGVRATPGNTKATVSWTAPASDGGSAITGYTVTSSPGSLTATTTGATTATVTGLTNGTAYTFTVTATNAIGTSGTSGTSGAVIFRPSLPPVGGATVMIGGVPTTSTVTANRQEGTIKVSGGNLQIMVAPKSSRGADLPLDSDGTAILNTDGGRVASSGRGFVQGSHVDFYLLNSSTATLLGDLEVSSDNTYSGSVPVPRGLASGTYTLQVNGLTINTRQRAVDTHNYSVSILVKVKESAVKRKAMQAVVYFDAFSPNLTKSAKRQLDAVVKRLPTKSNDLVRIVGFVGPGGSIGNIKTLSMARCESVERYLRSKGVSGKYVMKSGGNASGGGPSAQRAKVWIIPNNGT